MNWQKFKIAAFVTSFLFSPCFAEAKKDEPFFELETPFFYSSFEISVEKNKAIAIPRGILIRVNSNTWSCFDIERQQLAAVWQGKADLPVSLDSMASLTYPNKQGKASKSATIQGEIVYLNSNEKQGKPSGKWLGVQQSGESVVVHYQIGDRVIKEKHSWNKGFERELFISAGSDSLSIPLASPGSKGSSKLESIRVKPSKEATKLVIEKESKSSASKEEFKIEASKDPYPERIAVSSPEMKKERTPFVDIPLCEPNVYGRAIRPLDIAFTAEGMGYIVTLDGDVWQLSQQKDKQRIWKRAAAGFNEATNVEVTRDGKILILDRTGIVQLLDHDGDDWFEHHKCFSHAFIQTLHTRDYAMSMAEGPDGSVYVAKGGINNGKYSAKVESLGHRGCIIKLSPDGSKAEIYADGLRIPYVGVDQHGQVFASDQQGHYVPSTPVYKVEPNSTFGHTPTIRSKREISDAYLWFPYFSNRSAAGFQAITKSIHKDLSHILCHFSWDGKFFLIPQKSQTRFAWARQANADIPFLNGSFDPVSKNLYIAGGAISSYKCTTAKLQGLAKLSLADLEPWCIDAKVAKNQTELIFLNPIKGEVQVSALRAWNVKRSKKYGSGNYRWSGEPGMETIEVKNVTLSDDRKKMIIKHGNLFRSNIIVAELSINGVGFEFAFGSRHLEKPDKAAMQKSAKNSQKLDPPNAKRGEKLFQTKSCVGCHSLTGQKLTGPDLSKVGSRLSKEKIIESIVNPNREIAKGFEPNMPSFNGVLTEQEKVDLTHFLTLQK